MDPIAVTPVLVADLLVAGERMPVSVHVIDHPAARVLVDTGMTELHPALADRDPRLRPLNEQDLGLAGIDIVVNTHLHADHRGGNHLFAGKPIYVQRRELDDARSQDDHTIREWVEAPGVTPSTARLSRRSKIRDCSAARRATGFADLLQLTCSRAEWAAFGRPRARAAQARALEPRLLRLRAGAVVAEYYAATGNKRG